MVRVIRLSQEAGMGALVTGVALLLVALAARDLTASPAPGALAWVTLASALVATVLGLIILFEWGDVPE